MKFEWGRRHGNGEENELYSSRDNNDRNDSIYMVNSGILNNIYKDSNNNLDRK
jgi:hypothetical protein